MARKLSDIGKPMWQHTETTLQEDCPFHSNAIHDSLTQIVDYNEAYGIGTVSYTHLIQSNGSLLPLHRSFQETEYCRHYRTPGFLRSYALHG